MLVEGMGRAYKVAVVDAHAPCVDIFSSLDAVEPVGLASSVSASVASSELDSKENSVAAKAESKYVCLITYPCYGAEPCHHVHSSPMPDVD